MKKYYTMTFDVVSPEEMDIDGVRKQLADKGTFVNTEGNLWKVSCTDSDLFLEVLETLLCYSCGYSAEEYEDMKNNPDNYFETVMAA